MPAKNNRLRTYLKKYLREQEPQTTGQLLTRYNEDIKTGATMNQIGNVLGRDPAFFSEEITEVWDRGVRTRQTSWYLIE